MQMWVSSLSAGRLTHAAVSCLRQANDPLVAGC